MSQLSLALAPAHQRPLARRRTFSWLSLLALIPTVCFLDSAYLASHFAYGQWAADALMLAYFTWMYRNAPPRLRGLMKYGVVIGLAGESLFSLVFGMYEYRLHNIPLYVPPGHSVMLGAVYYFIREPFVRQRKELWGNALLLGGVAYSLAWLVIDHDVYGALCTALFVVLIVREPHSRMFFLTMFWFVAILEQAGTRLGAWYWYEHAFDKFTWLPSGNPPAGISVFYFAFDVLCLIAYLKRRPDLRARYRGRKGRGGEQPPEEPQGELAIG